MVLKSVQLSVRVGLVSHAAIGFEMHGFLQVARAGFSRWCAR